MKLSHIGIPATAALAMLMSLVPCPTGVVSVVVAFAAPQDGSARPDGELRADIQRRLASLDPGGSPISVEVRDGVVTLSGMVKDLWSKQEAVSRALKAGPVKSLVSNLTIPRAESDDALAREVGDRIRKYDLYSVYDDIQGRVRNGIVSLAGAVTAPNKLSDILERVAKVRGVQDINNKIEVLPESQSDDRLRVVIANAIYRDPAFTNYSMVDPPVHVIVNRGHVTLTGAVRTDLERFQAENNARMVSGILAFENKIQVAKKGR